MCTGYIPNRRSNIDVVVVVVVGGGGGGGGGGVCCLFVVCLLFVCSSVRLFACLSVWLVVALVVALVVPVVVPVVLLVLLVLDVVVAAGWHMLASPVLVLRHFVPSLIARRHFRCGLRRHQDT